MSDARMFPPGAALCPTGRVVMGPCGRRHRIASSKRGECTWCGAPVERPRVTWCSDECVAKVKALDWQGLRSRALKLALRDGRYWCALCAEPHEQHAIEVDHTVPIVEGGHPFDPTNLRALCSDCHKRETASLAGRRATARRDADAPLFTNTVVDT